MPAFTLFIVLASICIGPVIAKTALAHFMVQESFAFDVQQWVDDMTAAQQINLDGFALNWTPPDCSQPSLQWMATQIDNAFEAAEQTNFTLTHSFDMSYTSCNYYWNTTYMAGVLDRHASSNASLLWNNNLVVTTFGGDGVPSEYDNGFFQDLKNKMTAYGHSISLVPGFSGYSEQAQSNTSTAVATEMLATFPAMDGFLNWQAWPLYTRENLTTAVDETFRSALKTAEKTGPYIMAVSPWQFKNNGPGALNWISYSDTLFADRFESLVAMEEQPDMVELLTWNDYGESHYLRDLPSTVETATDYITYTSNMQNYILNMSHAPWRIMAKYYLAWWKTGTPPAVVMDQVVFWYRVHPKTSTCTSQPGDTILGSENPDDAVFMWALVQNTTTVTVNVGDNTNYQFIAEAGRPTMSRVPFPDDLGLGVTPNVTAVRDGVVVASGQGRVPIQTGCLFYDFNPVLNLAGAGVNTE